MGRAIPDAMTPLRERRVLLVDDESTVLMLVEDMLLDLGAAKVETAMDVGEARHAVLQAPIDLAVLDINLSGQTSYPIAELLRGQGVPFLFATGYGGPGHDRVWGEVPTLTKPFTQGDLARAIQGILSAGPQPGSPPSRTRGSSAA